MGYKDPPKETRFKKGQSGNPRGRAKLPEDLQKVKMLTKEHISKLINKYGSLTLAKLEEVMKAEESASFDVMICSAIRRAIVDGDVSRMDFLLNRTVGKVTDVAEVHQHNYDPALDELPKENIIQMLKAVNEG